MRLSEYLGIDLEYIVLGLAGIVVFEFLLILINMVTVAKVKKKYKQFMGETDALSLEDKIIEQIEQIDGLVESNLMNQDRIEKLQDQMKITFQKMGLVKYDAFDEMGGKLSFSLALLNERNDGFIINAMHSREGCYTYIKEIIDGESYIELAEEEAEALDKAIYGNYDADMKMTKK